jgi:tetratricopeptide (TPR) repeat protein
MRARSRALGLVVLVVAVSGPAAGVACPSSPAVEERRQGVPVSDADSEYDRGVRARIAKDWVAAADAFNQAVGLRPEFADAWNELGFALRNQGRYPEALDAYGEALRLRPDFPEALEYLGEAYVKLKRLDDARRVLERLRVLDAGRAAELSEEIRTATP